MTEKKFTVRLTENELDAIRLALSIRVDDMRAAGKHKDLYLTDFQYDLLKQKVLDVLVK